jgi:hypothetical protein
MIGRWLGATAKSHTDKQQGNSPTRKQHGMNSASPQLNSLFAIMVNIPLAKA